jgi:hypothetical protein
MKMGIGEQFEFEKTGRIEPEHKKLTRYEEGFCDGQMSAWDGLCFVYLVCAQWEYEGNADLVAYRSRHESEWFALQCEEYQKVEPDEADDAHSNWEDCHPAKPYLSVGDTLCGVESFIVIEVKVL